jgi:hypothetical protein
MFDLKSYRVQDIPFQCPYCYLDMMPDNIIGNTEYDISIIGHSLGGTANIFECPVCFEKSFCHEGYNG